MHDLHFEIVKSKIKDSSPDKLFGGLVDRLLIVIMSSLSAKSFVTHDVVFMSGCSSVCWLLYSISVVASQCCAIDV